MSLALSTRWVRDGADRLATGAEAAHELGFHAVHAARPPSDAATALPALQKHGLTLTGVSTAPLEVASALGELVVGAARAAARLKGTLVVVESGGLRGPSRGTLDAAVEELSRALHAALHAHPGLAVALRTADGPEGLVSFRAAEWLLSDLRDLPFGLWFDPASALWTERSPGGSRVLDWADRYGRSILGVAVHGLGDGRGHARPEDDGPEWGTLLGLLPSRAPRVLEVGPNVPAAEVADARRNLEEVLGW